MLNPQDDFCKVMLSVFKTVGIWLGIFKLPDAHPNLYRSRKLTFWSQIDEGLVQIPDDFPVFKHRWSSASCRPFSWGSMYIFIDSVIRLRYQCCSLSGLQPIHFAALESDVTSVQFLVEAPVVLVEVKWICMIPGYPTYTLFAGWHG